VCILEPVARGERARETYKDRGEPLEVHRQLLHRPGRPPIHPAHQPHLPEARVSSRSRRWSVSASRRERERDDEGGQGQEGGEEEDALAVPRDVPRSPSSVEVDVARLERKLYLRRASERGSGSARTGPERGRARGRETHPRPLRWYVAWMLVGTEKTAAAASVRREARERELS